MKKLLAALSCAAMVAIPTAANAADDAAVGVGGDYGHPLCYVSLDYFWADAGVSSRYPFVTVTYGGSVGGEVHCPLIAFSD